MTLKGGRGKMVGRGDGGKVIDSSKNKRVKSHLVI